MAERSIFTGKLRVIIPAIVLGIGAIIGLRFGIGYWLYSMKHVVTDDARHLEILGIGRFATLEINIRVLGGPS